MSKFIIETRQDLFNQIDSLRGNVSRMCVTDDTEELAQMREWALKRVEWMYEYNLKRLQGGLDLV